MPLGASSLETSHGINIGTSAFFGTPQYDPMTVGGVQYSTVNTPGLDSVHNRIYIVTQSVTASSSGTTDNTAAYNGAILAYNVSSSGTLSAPVDIFDFSGPSGSSPVVIPNYTYTDLSSQTHVGTAIFFDGQAKNGSGTPTTYNCTHPTSGSTAYGCFFGILDQNPTNATGVSNAATPMWNQIYSGGIFEAGAALDTSGSAPGIWVFPTAPSVYSTPNCPSSGLSVDANCLVKLDLNTGNTIQGPVNLTPLVTAATNTPYKDTTYFSDDYAPSSAVAVTHNGSSTYLTMAVTDTYRGALAPAGRVVTVDVTSTLSAPALVWASDFFDQHETNPGLALGQFVIATYTSGSTSHTNVIFTGQFFGPWFIGN